MTKRHPPTPAGLTVLTASDVDTLLSTLDAEPALDIQARVFKSFSAQHAAQAADAIPGIQAPQRIVTTTPAQTMLFMPSRAAEAGGTAIKIVSVPNNGGAEGLPATTLVLDEESGKVKGVVNARKLTALRNACGSALSYRVLHPDGKPTSLVVFGSGAQADAHIRLFIKLWPSITQVTLVARRPTPRSASLMISLTHAFPSITLTFGVNDPSASASASQADVEHAVDMPNLLGQADIIITCTPSTEPLFDGNLVKAGAHLALIGSYKPHMREVDDRLIERAGVVLVDSKEACGTEAGELIRANVTDEGMVELGQTLVDKEQVGRVVSGGDVTLFKSVSGTCSKRKVEEVSEREELMRQVGIGIQDVAVAALVLEQAQAAGLGTTIPDYDFAG